MKKLSLLLIIVFAAAGFQAVCPLKALSAENEVLGGHDREENPAVVKAVPGMATPEENAILERLNEVRQEGDIDAAGKLQTQLDQLHGITVRPSLVMDTDIEDIAIEDASSLAGPAPLWTGDIPVTDAGDGYDAIRPAMTAAPNGDLYVALEHDSGYWIRVFRSTDDGASWSYIKGFRSGSSSHNPSIAFVDGSSQDYVYVAYEGYDSDISRTVKVYRLDPATLLGDFLTVDSGIYMPGSSYHVYPEICTDNADYTSGYYVYVTYTVGSVDINPVYFSRSTDEGDTWSTPTSVHGGGENSSWIARPDIAYGCADNDLFIAFTKLGWNGVSWENQIWVTKSTTFGSSWDSPVQLTTSTYGAYHPRVAAADDVNSAVIAFTYEYSTDSDIRDYYSLDSGATWLNGGSLPYTPDDEKGVELTVSNDKFHAAFWRDYYIRHTTSAIATPSTWSSSTGVNDNNYASSVYSRPGLCVNPTKPVAEEACVTWSDFRSSDGPDYEVYFDTAATSGPAVTVSLSPDSTSIPRGGSLGYWVTVTNTTGSTQCFDYWTDVTLPSGTIYPPSGELFGPYYLCLNPYDSTSAHLGHPIPMGAPLGAYTYHGYVGSYPVVDNEDHFNFDVTP